MSEQLLPRTSSKNEKALEQASARVNDVPVQIGDLWSAERCPGIYCRGSLTRAQLRG